MLSAGNRHDLQVLQQARTGHMQPTVSRERAFKYLDAGESVLWSSVPVLQEAVADVSLSLPIATLKCRHQCEWPVC